MTRFTRSGNGKYVVQGKSYDMLIGTRAQVWHGTAFKTSGGLTKTHIMQNKNGRIVSRSKHSQAKKDNRLVRAGYGTKKGTFGFVKLSKGKSKRGGGSDSTNTNSSNSNSSGSNANLMKLAVASKMSGSDSGAGYSSGIGSKKGGAGPMNNNNTSSSSSSDNNMAKLAVASKMSNSDSNSDSSNNVMKMAAASKMSGNSSGPTKGGRGRRRKGTRKMKGGMYALSPHSYNGKNVGTSGVDVQFLAGNAG
jgi:hypothetical protein